MVAWHRCAVRHRSALAAIVTSFVAAFASTAQTAVAQSKPEVGPKIAGPISVHAEPLPSFVRIGRDQTHVGKLEYIGGLVLSAPDVGYFGGWSGLALDADGKGFVAVSDRGVWLTGKIAYQQNGAPRAIEDARIGPLLSLDGKPFRRDRDRDAEAVAIERGTARSGAMIVSYEQNSRLVRYDMARDGMSTARSVLDLPRSAAGMRRNNGLEAMTVMKGGPFKGAPVAVSERYFDKHRNHTGWIWSAKGPQSFHIANIGDFDVTDIASLDDGTLFVLERRFRWLEGVKMRIRQIAAGDLVPGKTADADTLMEANLEYQIDNMEALAATRNATGDIVLTVMSDDNFNRVLQRTLLLQFALKSTETAKARPQQ